MEGETKQKIDQKLTSKIDQKLTFFISLFYFSKSSGYKETKNTNFLKGIA